METFLPKTIIQTSSVNLNTEYKNGSRNKIIYIPFTCTITRNVDGIGGMTAYCEVYINTVSPALNGTMISGAGMITNTDKASQRSMTGVLTFLVPANYYFYIKKYEFGDFPTVFTSQGTKSEMII
jgi:hypothetical protein